MRFLKNLRTKTIVFQHKNVLQKLLLPSLLITSLLVSSFTPFTPANYEINNKKINNYEISNDEITDLSATQEAEGEVVAAALAERTRATENVGKAALAEGNTEEQAKDVESLLRGIEQHITQDGEEVTERLNYARPFHLSFAFSFDVIKDGNERILGKTAADYVDAGDFAALYLGKYIK